MNMNPWAVFTFGWCAGLVAGFLVGWAIRYLRIKSLVTALVKREFVQRDEARRSSAQTHPARPTRTWVIPKMQEASMDGSDPES